MIALASSAALACGGASGDDDGGVNGGFGGTGATASGAGGSVAGGFGTGGTTGVAGSAGSAGAIGGGGVLGTSGSAGSAGTAGIGQAGASGTSGAAGTPGGAGKGGTSGGGTAGGAGAGGTSAGKGGAGGAGGSTAGTGGQGTAGSTGGKCQPLAAPASMQQTIDLTWQEMTGGFQGRTGARPTSASILNFRNTIIDQLFAAGGSLRYCVRWDSSGTVTTAQRDQIAGALQRWINTWFTKLVNYDCWPYSQPIPVTVTGWATRNRSQLAWSENTPPVYVNMIRENAPECDSRCGRFFHQQPGYQYPDCPGGFANHYDMSLWLTDGFQGGVGGDWGQRLAPAGVLNNLAAASQIIVVHEMGHGLGFPDYYNWSVWAPGVAAPPTIMNAGAAAAVTDWDGWMLRWTWSRLRSRFQLP